MSGEWLPPLVLLEDSGGDWNAYEETLYGFFKIDFLESLPRWPGKRVGLKRYPESKGKVATFWHFISEGEYEDERLINTRRCERIRWPRPTMEAYAAEPPAAGSRIIWWMNKRGAEWRYLLALPDFSYLVVVADRGEYVLPWTQFPVEKPHQREKYRKECRDYWKGRKS